MTTLNTKLPTESGHGDDVSLDLPVDNDTMDQDLAELENKSNTSVKSPNVRGSASIMGSEADPESDDDVLQNAHKMGIAPNASLNNATPLNIAKDVAEAEEYRRTH